MINLKEFRRPSPLTMEAIEKLVEFFTPRDKEVLKLKRNGQEIGVGEQLLARWWNYVPLCENLFVFRVEAMKKLMTNRLYIDLIEKVESGNLFDALLNPDNYKDKTKVVKKLKDLGKRQSTLGTSSANVNKSLGRIAQGDAAVGISWDYSESWDSSDRRRFDNMMIKQTEQSSIVETTKEQEEGDDSFPPVSDIKEESIVDQKERLDYKSVEKINVPLNSVSFQSSASAAPDEKGIRLHTAHVMHNATAVTNERAFGSNSFLESLKRSNSEDVKEKMVLADVLNSIQNLRFVDLRESFYKEFDILFTQIKKGCHL